MTKICVIGESDPFVAQLLQRFAEESGLQAMRAAVSQDMLALIKELEPVVVVLDAELPGELQGWEVIRQLRAEPFFSATPVISCSWLNRARASALMGKLAGHLKKPELHYADFMAALRMAGIPPVEPVQKNF